MSFHPVMLVGVFGLTLNAGEGNSLEPREAGWSGHASYVAGYKQLDSDWSPVEGQLEFGLLDLDLQPPNWPFSLCSQLLLTYADQPPGLPGAVGDYSGAWEINFGGRKVFGVSDSVELFIGGGISYLGASVSSSMTFGWGAGQIYEASDSTFGYWTSGGLYWNLSEHWHVGLAFQYSWGEIELFDADLNAGGFHALGLFGYHW